MGSTNVRRVGSMAEDIKAHAELLENDPRADRKGTIRIMLSLATALKASLEAELVLEERISLGVVRAPKVPPVPKPAQKSASLEEKPARRGDAWTDDEDRRLMNGFDAGATAKQLAERHGRSVGAIRSRLEKLGRLKPEAS